MKKIEHVSPYSKVNDFIGTINETLSPIKAVCLDKYEFDQNGVSINIYKIAITPVDILTIEMNHVSEKSDEYGVERYEETTSKIKHVKYNPDYSPKNIDMWPFSKVNLEKIISETKVQLETGETVS